MKKIENSESHQISVALLYFCYSLSCIILASATPLVAVPCLRKQQSTMYQREGEGGREREGEGEGGREGEREGWR